MKKLILSWLIDTLENIILYLKKKYCKDLWLVDDLQKELAEEAQNCDTSDIVVSPGGACTGKVW